MKSITRVRFVKSRVQRELRWVHQRYLGGARDSVILDMDSDSHTLLLIFGGLGSDAGVPSFEFGSITREIPVKRLFVRDVHQAWYHQGMPRHGRTFASMAESLSELLAPHDIDRLVVAGNSAGGYAALVFGTLLGADAVLSFAPQTVLNCDMLAEMDDHRWDWRLGRSHRKGRCRRAGPTCDLLYQESVTPILGTTSTSTRPFEATASTRSAFVALMAYSSTDSDAAVTALSAICAIVARSSAC